MSTNKSTEKTKGKIGVQSDNMFPIIKKFLYSDNEIFLREIVSNAVDATQKLRTLSSKGEYKGELGDLKVEVRIEEDKIIVSDQGIGMSTDEIQKYINQIAISGAEEFIEKHKEDAATIIGHFGLGFYSSFMVAQKVEIYTQSYRDEEESVRWSCEGDPTFELQVAEKRDRGTDIILHIDEESKEFLEPSKIESLLHKYCSFLPVPIVFIKKEGEEPVSINETEPLWTKTPSELKKEDYLEFYQKLYPFSEEPLFWIHLNIDYPFNLTGILYFPKVKNSMDLQKNKIQLYSNQVFVTDNVEGIVPEFLSLLHGVLDSPDIPLNVSRSYLQADHNVKKISSYITRKVAEKLTELFKTDRTDYEEKWEALDLFVKYGMLSDEKFYEKAEKFCLLQSSIEDRKDQHFTLEEYRSLISEKQTDKDGKVVYLYAINKEEQYPYIKASKNKGFDVLLLDGPLDMHLIGMLEEKLPSARFARVDSDTLNNLIKKDEGTNDEQKMSPNEETLTKALFNTQVPKENKEKMFSVSVSYQGDEEMAVVVHQNEFMRRMKDMSKMQQGMNIYGTFPDSYVLNVNLNNPLVKSIVSDFNKSSFVDKEKELKSEIKGFDARLNVLSDQIKDESTDDNTKETLRKDQKETEEKITELQNELDAVYSAFCEQTPLVAHLIDLSLLSSGLLKGAALNNFILRSTNLLNK